MTPKLKIELPDDERGVSPETVTRFDRLRRKLARTDLKPAQREAALDELANLEHSPRINRDRAEMERSIAETAALATGRGEEVAPTKTGGVRITSHDGLQSLFDRERLTRDQYEEGQAYRKDREMRMRDLGSQLGGEGAGGSAHDNHQFVATRFERAKATEMVGKIDRAVALKAAGGLNFLRWVAGDGQSLSVWGRGHVFYRNVQALRDALDVAAEARKAEMKRRKEAQDRGY